MRKLIAIIFMFIIASNSYYGVVDDKGEKVTDIQEVLKEQKLITNEMIEEQKNEIAEQESNEKTQEVVKSGETQIEKMQVQENSVATKTEVKQQSVKTQESKPKIVETKTEVKQETKQEVKTPEKPKQETKTEVKVQESETPKCSDTKHGVGVGNSNKWFNSYNEAVAYYDDLINGYSNQVHNEKITPEEYNKKCPYGYEVWSCPYCNKWTLNFYFR